MTKLSKVEQRARDKRLAALGKSKPAPVVKSSKPVAVAKHQAKSTPAQPETKQAMVLHAFRISEAELEALRALALREDRSVGYLIRRAVKGLLAKQ